MVTIDQLGNMLRVNHKGLRELLLKSYSVSRSLFIWGTIGIGKSDEVDATAREIAKAEGLEYSKDVLDEKKFSMLDVRLAQMDVTDVKGIPFKSKNEKSTEWLLPDWFPRDPNSKGILFFDELPLAPPSVQSACYSIIRDRKIGSYHLPKGWVCVSAGNRVEDMSNVFETAKALENRFAHCELVTPTIDAWKDWAINKGVDKRIISFLMWRPDKLMQFNPDDETLDLKEKAFATPRTWEYASDYIKGENNLEKLEKLVAINVGNGNAVEFIAYLQLRQTVDFAEILKNPERVEDLADREDLLYSVVTVISDWYRDNHEKKHLQRICQISEHLRAEFAILLLRFCKREHEKKFTSDIKEIPEWKNNLSQQYKDYIL